MGTANLNTHMSRDALPAWTRRGLLAAIVLIAAFLRLYRLGDLPPPMNADEASRGYDAWSLWQTGRDQFGVHLPAFLRSFGPGDYSSATSAYLSAPLSGLTGFGVRGIRLTTALAGIATVLFVYGWLNLVRCGRWALIAAAILAVNPWHVRISRWAHEAHLTPFFLAAGFYFLARAGFFGRSDHTHEPAPDLQTDRRVNIRPSLWAAASGLAFGLGAWSYHAPRLVIPLLMLGIAALAGRTRNAIPHRARGFQWPAVALGLVIGAMPILWTLVQHPERLMGRVKYTSVFSSETLKSPGITDQADPGMARRVLTAGRQYLWYFDPVMLAWRSEVEQGLTAPGYSRLTLPEIVLLGCGIVRLILTCRRDVLHRVLLIGLLLYPLPAALSVGPAASSLRAVCGMPILMIVEALGATWLLGRPAARFALGALVAGMLVHGVATARFYVNELPARLSHANGEELFEAFTWAAQFEHEATAIYVTPRANQPQALMLVATRFDPDRLHKSTRVDIPWNAGFDQTLQIDKWHFLPKRDPDPWELTDLPGLVAAHPPGSRILILCRPFSPSRGQFECPLGQVVRTFTARDGRVWLEARTVVTPTGEVRENRPDS